MHDTTALRRPEGSTNSNPRFVALHRRFPTVAYLREKARRTLPQFRLRVLRWRRRRRRRHCAQLERAQCGRTRAALWRHHGLAAGRHRAVRPPLRRADRRRPDGRAVAGLSRRRPVSRRGRAARERALHARPRRRHDGRAGGRDRARRALVPALSLLRATSTRSASISSSAPTLPASRCWCSRSTCRCAPRARARWRSGITTPFRPDLQMMAGILSSPGYLRSLMQNGQPRFGNLKPYTKNDADVNEVAAFVRREMGGAFTWDEVARYRERWKRPLVVKGIMHPADAEKCVALGVDGIVVSNHGGRQVEGLPAAIDVLPAIAGAVGGRAAVMMDSGIRSGLDVARAVALGADLAFAGKAFLWGLGALGADGPGHVIDLMVDEMKSAFGQIGARKPDGSALGRDPPSRRLRFLPQFALKGPLAGRNVAPTPRASLVCAGHRSDARRRAAKRADRISANAPFGEGDVGARRTGGRRCHQRPPRAAQRAGAVGGAGAGGRQQHGAGRDRRHRRHHAGPRQGARDPADQHLRARHVDEHAADGLAGAQSRAAHGVADRHGVRRADRAHLLRRGAAGIVSAVQHRGDLQRLLRLGAPVLSFRRDRYRERRLQGEGDLLGAGRRHFRRDRRPATRHRHQGSVAAVSLRRELHRPVGVCAGRGRRADAAQHPAAAAADGDERGPAAGGNRPRSRASSWRSAAAS